ncbi:hypothetical protein BDV27DRAFT_139523 [Aspergillus caelatus]|uniref:Uncharacterized protein n=1 Tax=Aspergillus caelatus TaxID=61420 RepID=A0A5N6ZJC8_9EURO|nr:uncharacterized protein BDV27DRAFT_139523 [Aspergillus caelatus]KAE8357333.1 hypothetical protein BDV27DRAFT_139523 [Aspergillus caelatus]
MRESYAIEASQRSIVIGIESLNLEDMRYNKRNPFSEIGMSATIRRKTTVELKKKWNLLFCFFFLLLLPIHQI